MKIVIAPDSFKESLTALQVAQAIEIGFKKIFPDAEYIKVPMADGGEGTVQSLIDAWQGQAMVTEVTAPLGNKVLAEWGLSADRKTAIIEMAAASGLHLVAENERNPLITGSYGTGELIKAALNFGVEKIILGIGGSATNDAGVGMLQALGAAFLDDEGKPLVAGGAALKRLSKIDLSALDPRLATTQIEVACDVDNPLCGERGASAVFGPQKGATAAMIKELDAALSLFSQKVKQQLNKDIANIAGAGAAGGMGAGLQLLPKCRLKSGVDIILEATHLSKVVADADLVITGEGRMDSQTVYGKTPVGVAKTAKRFHKPVIAIVGCLRADYEVVYDAGIDAVFPIIRNLASLSDTLAQGRENLISTAQNVARTLKLKI
ncbi:glycerate kinase [Gallibacterium anatis]|uniref:glycerate kinase n=1 Tax=Gallibacterium anatis TaxID=750 RepID=UPI0005312A70|nr:glycerate kinase [Gallibacterium anatis]KGQ28087.1 glycerate kinase [Gallibacterium anatis]KGQ45491.1 glycerate kinase [Gallibacterium anatis]KGQ61534.1 glycerate kinase [Gallibacterium anatis]KGQ66995.1 glycerate kinase [Gallibacterium anatis]